MRKLRAFRVGPFHLLVFAVLRSIKKPEGLSAGALIIEVFSIILAVAIGFGVNEWREARANRARSADALRSIAAEMSRNRADLGRRQPYYQRMEATLDSLLQASELGALSIEDVPGWQGLSPPFLRAASYEVASTTGALAHVDFELADTIAQVHVMQRSMQQTVDYALEAMMTGQLDEVQDWLRTFQLFNELSRVCIDLYDQAGLPMLQRSGYLEAS